MFKQRKKIKRLNRAQPVRSESQEGKIISAPNSPIEVVQVDLSSKTFRLLQVPASAFACLSVNFAPSGQRR